MGIKNDDFNVKFDFYRKKDIMPYLEKLKKIKEQRKLTNAEIATLSTIPLATVTKIFNGSTPNPTFESVASIAMALGVSLDEVVGLKEPGEKPIDSKIETTITSYAELLKAKDELFKEKEERIKELKAERDRAQKEKGRLLTFLIVLVAAIVFVLLFDMMNGHMGYFRY